MIVPNKGRLLVSKVKGEVFQDNNIVLPGQLKSGENLFAGEVIDPGETKLHKGQLVWYSEFSCARIVDMGKVLRGEWKVDEAIKADNLLYVVAEDDIMAYDNDYDFAKVSPTSEESKPKTAA